MSRQYANLGPKAEDTERGAREAPLQEDGRQKIEDTGWTRENLRRGAEQLAVKQRVGQGEMVCRERLGGLLKHYERVAA